MQGIQSFIFQTNKLREIVGASELVEEICTTKFESLFQQIGVNYDMDNCILHAAGNIKYIFDDKSDCEKIVREFPKAIFEFAPGITVSQAVVKFNGDDFKTAVNELEKRLRTQRNKPMRSATLGLMGIERSRQTGLPVVGERKVKGKWLPVDAGTQAKLDMFKHADEPDFELTKSLCNTAFGKEKLFSRQIAYDIEKMTEKNDWIAIIHADGNGLGQIVQAVGTDKDKFKSFSENLDKATKIAAVKAYNDVKNLFNEDKFIPIRPIVLGGDDFTTICRADIALDYVTAFIDNFEKETSFIKDFNSDKLKFNNLTACAGIAYIKSSFPFYYGYELAEALCTQAKKDAKANLADGELAKSCLMFHKVQDSFTEDWNAISKRELTPQPNISFQYGPYYLKAKDNRMTVENLKEYAEKLEGKEGNAVKSHLRQWMSMLHYNPGMANQKLLRLISMTDEPQNKKKFELHTFIDCTEKDKKKEVITFLYNNTEDFKSPVYDILTIHTINNQMTKIKETKP